MLDYCLGFGGFQVQHLAFQIVRSLFANQCHSLLAIVWYCTYRLQTIWNTYGPVVFTFERVCHQYQVCGPQWQGQKCLCKGHCIVNHIPKILFQLCYAERLAHPGIWIGISPEQYIFKTEKLNGGRGVFSYPWIRMLTLFWLSAMIEETFMTAACKWLQREYNSTATTNGIP